jgi:nitrogenase molybdenum-iron protein NifN
MLGQKRVAIAADPDQLNAFTCLVQELGAEVVAAVAPSNAPALSVIPLQSVKIGDLEDLELLAREHKAEVLIGNSHAAGTSERLGIPLLRAGFPLYDIIGGYQKTWIGYRGSRQALFDLANLVLDQSHHEIAVYHSVYAQKQDEVQGSRSKAETVLFLVPWTLDLEPCS